MVFSSLDLYSAGDRNLTSFLCCSNKEKGKVNRQKAVKKRGPFTDFQEDLIKDLFERCDLFEFFESTIRLYIFIK